MRVIPFGLIELKSCDQPRQTSKARALLKLCGFGAIAGFSALDFIFRVSMVGGIRCSHARAAWLQRICRRLLWLLEIEVTTQGTPPASGLLVCNHLSYIDIIVLAAGQPLAFVSKHEVRSWPIIGWLAGCAGTLFIDRERRKDVVRIGAELVAPVSQGIPVCVFPEGTSSDGTTVLPFRTSLLEPAAAHGWQVTPAWIGYSLYGGSVPQEVCYWGEMTFLTHFFNLLGHKRIKARVAYAPAAVTLSDRKELATILRAEVIQLSRSLHPSRQAA